MNRLFDILDAIWPKTIFGAIIMATIAFGLAFMAYQVFWGGLIV